MSMNQHNETVQSILAKASPPSALVAAKSAGIVLADWVTYLTLLYLVLMIGHKVWHIVKEWRSGKATPE